MFGIFHFRKFANGGQASREKPRPVIWLVKLEGWRIETSDTVWPSHTGPDPPV
jgi:hypothetical protein